MTTSTCSPNILESTHRASLFLPSSTIRVTSNHSLTVKQVIACAASSPKLMTTQLHSTQPWHECGQVPNFHPNSGNTPKTEHTSRPCISPVLLGRWQGIDEQSTVNGLDSIMENQCCRLRGPLTILSAPLTCLSSWERMCFGAIPLVDDVPPAKH